MNGAATIVFVSGSTVACMHPNGRDQLLFRADSPRHAEYQANILRALLGQDEAPAPVLRVLTTSTARAEFPLPKRQAEVAAQHDRMCDEIDLLRGRGVALQERIEGTRRLLDELGVILGELPV